MLENKQKEKSRNFHDFVYNLTLYFLPLPDLLISESRLRAPFDSIKPGHPLEYYTWCNEKEEDKSQKRVNLPNFINNITNLRFNYQYLPFKYRNQLKVYYYLHKTTIHSLFPFYANTSSNYFLESLTNWQPLGNLSPMGSIPFDENVFLNAILNFLQIRLYRFFILIFLVRFNIRQIRYSFFFFIG